MLALRYPVQFNAARIDTLPILPHNQGWAVYDSGMKLPLSFNFGAARSSDMHKEAETYLHMLVLLVHVWFV